MELTHLLKDGLRDEFVSRLATQSEKYPDSPIYFKTIATRPENPMRVTFDQMPYVFFAVGSNPRSENLQLIGELPRTLSIYAYLTVCAETATQAQVRLSINESRLRSWQCKSTETTDTCLERLERENLISGSLDYAGKLKELHRYQIKSLPTVVLDVQETLIDIAQKLSIFDISTALEFSAEDQQTYERCRLGEFSTTGGRLSTPQGEFAKREFIQTRFDFQIGDF